MKNMMEGFTNEQRKNVKKFDSLEEFRKYAEAEGINLTDIELQDVNGGLQETDGEDPNGKKCPKCGSRNTYEIYYFPDPGVVYYKCRNCGHVWSEFVG